MQNRTIFKPGLVYHRSLFFRRPHKIRILQWTVLGFSLSRSLWREHAPIEDMPRCGFASKECDLVVIMPALWRRFLLRKNYYASGILQVILLGGSRKIALMSHFDDNKTISHDRHHAYARHFREIETVPTYLQQWSGTLQVRLQHAVGNAQPQASLYPINLFGIKTAVLFVNKPRPMLALK